MKRALVIFSVIVALGLAVGIGVVGLGLYNVSATAGHLPGVAWVLHTTFKNSVSLRAPPENEVPLLDDPDLVALGAGHYATGCVPCHGSPDEPALAFSDAMLPEPPPIKLAIAGWSPNELHWVVENGVKMSGMPGWPAPERSDEVWAVVAYLEKVKEDDAPPLPKSTSESIATSSVAYCGSCHGTIDGLVPRLDIQDAEYLREELREYVTGVRLSGIMQQAASVVPVEDLPRLAEHFAATINEAPDPLPVPVAGERLANRGTREVPACTACHGPGASADETLGPRLSGQHRAFLETQLRLWRDGVRTDSAKMVAAARALSDADIALLAKWYASQPADGER
ncbi:c-type cytochrome [Silicimonas algicola]|uniref:Cytochrome c553 n=1 Tax=Silicimonas algicola TaxID=1826607 RepID=A0A316G9B4_9RHOB|nr:c-type cytochrome [Silicimonas algicola]AZQ67481.1 c-type cytochrome [Silicimonas algicola]PWK57173.1 cytochrome c553 [Silicimonas algicola]